MALHHETFRSWQPFATLLFRHRTAPASCRRRGICFPMLHFDIGRCLATGLKSYLHNCNVISLSPPEAAICEPKSTILPLAVLRRNQKIVLLHHSRYMASRKKTSTVQGSRVTSRLAKSCRMFAVQKH